MLADIGEGITECEVIQWFVAPGATIEEFDPICEVQSDKASVEITSRYTGVVKKLHYDVGQMALVGKPLVDIDIPDSVETPAGGQSPAGPAATTAQETQPEAREDMAVQQAEQMAEQSADQPKVAATVVNGNATTSSGRHKALATPAVRRVCSELGINIVDVNGTGKDGRVMKEDVMRYHSELQNIKPETPSSQDSAPSSATSATAVASLPVGEATTIPLNNIQKQMFKTMSRSLAIPHFLYTDEIELDNLVALRKRANAELASEGIKLSFMPFFIKALSLALLKYPLLNSRVVYEGDKPMVLHRPFHNISIAMDTPNGLVVPNIKNVQNLSIYEIGKELLRLQELGAANKLGPTDLKDGTVSLSNIGTVGGTYVAPVIVENEVCIGGLGKARTVPRYDDNMQIVPRTVLNVSWSGDHRIIDGVTMARMVDLWKSYVENPEQILLRLR